MKRMMIRLLLATTLCTFARLAAAAPADTQLNAAQAAVTAWLAILDTGDYREAASGFADEVLAAFNFPTKEEKVASANLALLDPITRRGQFGVNPAVKRTLKPEGVKTVTSCPCGIRDRVFYTFAYDVEYTWEDHRFHVQRFRSGTDIVYMLREPDGTWKPAAITSTFGRIGFR
jgi:hypothetical protein